MAITDLLRHLDAAAAAELETLRARAAEEVGEIEERAAAECARRRRAGLERLAAERAAAIRRGLAAAEHEARRRVLVARASAVQRVLDAAARRLPDLPLPVYRDRLPALVDEALRFLEGDAAVVTLRPEAAAAVEPLLDGWAGVTLEAGPGAAAGVLGRAADGSVTVDNTFPARLDRQRAALAIAIAERLDGDDGCGSTT